MNPSHIITEITERIKKNIDPEKIILFGSRAHGSPRENSDFDFFVIKNVEKEKVRELVFTIRKCIRKIILEKDVEVDIFADSQTRIDYRVEKIKDQFYQEIIDKGKVLYAK